MPITTYGKDFLPWNSWYSTTGGSIGDDGLWYQFEASCTESFYPMFVSSGENATPIGIEIGYGPTDAEILVGGGLTEITWATPGRLIPKGSRVVGRIFDGAAAGASLSQVGGPRGDKWAPDFETGVPRRLPVTPMFAVGNTTTTYGTLVTVKYPFILTTVWHRGGSGTNNGDVTTFAVGEAGLEVPIFQIPSGRGDNAIGCSAILNPPPLPIAAGSRISAKRTNGTGFATLAGIRLDI